MKKNWIPHPDEFYIGYLPKAPDKTSLFLKWTLSGLAISIIIIGSLLVYSQRRFSDAAFDYGVYTTLEGQIFNYPVPHLKLKSGAQTISGKDYKTILLVGPGKAGADKTLANFESSLGELEGKLVRISGQMIHGDGKTLLQVSDDRLTEIIQRKGDYEVPAKESIVGITSTITGEIVDPKCFFGVMKPGEGKTHRSCAIRCIAGGIPPVFHATNTSEHLLLLDENFRPVNELIPDIVGDKIELTGKVIQWDDWKILLINNELLKRLAAQKTLRHNLALMQEGMTQCNME